MAATRKFATLATALAPVHGDEERDKGHEKLADHWGSLENRTPALNRIYVNINQQAGRGLCFCLPPTEWQGCRRSRVPLSVSLMDREHLFCVGEWKVLTGI